MEILKQVPGQRALAARSTPDTDARLRGYAEQKGVARERIVFAPKLANAYHLARYPLADLFLDTSPYGAHTTASDALWMGVPVLTLSRPQLRVAGLRQPGDAPPGLPELICATPDEFVERAIALAHDPARLKSCRDRLESGRNTCVLFDMDRLTSRLEDLYRQMATEHQAGRTAAARPDQPRRLPRGGARSSIRTRRRCWPSPDYHGLYREKLRLRHLARPIAPDARLWTEAEIAEADRAPTASLAAGPAAAAA